MIDYYPVLSFAAGCLLGAWLTYRARAGLSPLPSIPLPKKAEEKPTGELKLPKVAP